jgi:uncharacterized membrane protein YeaQ/YmgE (transglycosylase-associated protein family)
MWTIDISSAGTLASAIAARMTSSESSKGRPSNRSMSVVGAVVAGVVTVPPYD